MASSSSTTPKNVLGSDLQPCCTSPMTGYYRDGFCNTCPSDVGSHTVCAEVTEDFLEYTKQKGNNLSTPMPAYGFPGLKPGDGWCLCASRWLEAQQAGHAPYVKLQSTHANALDTIPLDTLKQYAAPEVEATAQAPHPQPAGATDDSGPSA